jgi:carbon storage regulator
MPVFSVLVQHLHLIGHQDPNHFLREGNTMLVLSRKLGESICIDDKIKITITGIDRNKVRIGITAPTDMRVDREEVRNRMAGLFEVVLADEPQVAGAAR